MLDWFLLSRNAIKSTLLKQWIRNLEGEKGILARGDVSLVQVRVQVPLIFYYSLELFGTLNNDLSM